MSAPASILLPNALRPSAAETVSAHNSKAIPAILCAHCRLPVPLGLIEPGKEHQFCCSGCAAVFATIHACGMESYYRLIDAARATLTPAAKPGTSKFDAFDAPAFEKLYVETRPDGSRACDLVLEGITCAACVWLIEKLPRVAPGVIVARLSLRESTVRITWDPRQIALSQVGRTLAGLGYIPHPARGQSRRMIHRKEERKRLIHIGISGAIAGNVMLLAAALYAAEYSRAADMDSSFRLLMRYLSMGLGILSLAWPGANYFRSAWTALRLRSVNLDVPIVLALLAGGLAGVINTLLNRGEIYFDALSTLVFLLLVGRFLQYRQQRRADDAVELLFSMTPATCRIVREKLAEGPGEEIVEAPIEAVQIGDLVEVLPAGLIPCDGTVESGKSNFDQALLTGESAPVSVGPGAVAYAGSRNLSSPVRIRVSQTGSATRVGRLMQLVERGISEKPPVVQFADRAGLAFIVIVTLVAIGIFTFWSMRSMSAAIDHTVAFLIVTCPCVLGLATLLSFSLAAGRLARRDILVKSGTALELLARRGRLLLDKTGTLTVGELSLLAWHGDASIQPWVAELERHSTHPAARALTRAFSPDDSSQSGPREQVAQRLTDIAESPGGIRGTLPDGRVLRAGSPAYLNRQIGENAVEPESFARTDTTEAPATQILFALDNHIVAAADLGDQVRSDSLASVEQLQRFGWRPQIVSGDNRAVVDAVAKQLHIDKARAETTPEQKLQLIHDLAGEVSQKHTRSTRSVGPTIMIGDGANDAAALAAADVGIAVHGGAEASLAAADIYLARPGLAPVVDLITTARRTMRTIHRNFLISLAYNLFAGTLAATGLMHPLLAAILMPLSSASVLTMAIVSSREPRNRATRNPSKGAC